MQVSENLSSDERVKRLFSELQEKNIFDRKIKLIEDKKISNFQGLNFFGMFKQLKYNPIFFKNFLAQYDDDIVRFILLHEAGHIETGSLFRIENILAALIFVIIVVSFCIWVFLVGIFVLIASIISGAIVVAALCLIVRLSLKSLKEGEFSADDYSLQMMIDNFQILDPCSLIDKVFGAMDSIENKTNYHAFSEEILGNKRSQKFLLKMSGLQNGYHPTNKERADHLRKIAKSN
jgi:Zn-dependent protease with chaperone function